MDVLALFTLCRSSSLASINASKSCGVVRAIAGVGHFQSSAAR